MTLTPSQGPTGITVTVSGTGFTPNTAISAFKFNGATPASQSCTSQATSGSGTFSCTFTVPSDAAGGYSVTATGSDAGTDTATTTFTITTPTITLTPSQGPTGISVTVSGTGFTPDTGISTFKFDGGTPATQTCTAQTTSSSGAFSCTFTVPSDVAAGYTVAAAGSDAGADTASTTFTVTTPAISMTPTQGPTGITVTVSGTGFTPDTATSTFKFNGATPATQTCTAQTTSSSGAFSCTFTVPSDAAGGYSVVATGSDAGADTAGTTFTITTPTITVNPVKGPAGVVVTVSGTGFTPNTAISSFKFNGVTPGTQTCTAQTTSATGTFSCTFTAPSDAAGGYTIVATGGDGGSDTASATFTITTPTITVSPAKGPSGSTFTVTGAGFSLSSGATVTFNSVLQTPGGCTDGSFSGTTITTDASGDFVCTFTVPTVSAGSYPVEGEDTATSTTTAMQSFLVTPQVVTVSPGQGPTGSSVTLTGTGFTVSNSVTVTFAGNSLVLTSCSSGTLNGAKTTITTTPSGGFICLFAVPSSSAGAQTVQADDLGSGEKPMTTFTVTTPAITVTPGQGPVGATVTVAGTGFSASTSLASLVFDGVPVTSCISGSQTTGSGGAFSCMFSVPGGTSGTTVTATDVGGQQATGMFTITTPTITVTPGQGPVGATFSVIGSGFSVSSGATVTLNSVLQTPSGCTDGTFSGTTITTDGSGDFVCTFTIPILSAGPYSLTGNDTASITLTAPQTLLVTTPEITVTPGRGPVGATVTVAGTGFSVSTALASLVFDEVTISSCTSGSLTTGGGGAFSCTFSVPGGPSGTTVMATDRGGQHATGAFSVTSPAISVTPGQGPVGATVTVAGTGFSVSTVLASLVFGGVAVTGCSSGSLTASSVGAFSCTFSVPKGVSGTIVMATDVGGQNAIGVFAVTTPTITITPAQGPVGSTYTVTGSGFSASSGATVSFDSILQSPSGCADGSFSGTTITTDGSGDFVCTFTVPNEGDAPYSVVGKDSATSTLTSSQEFNLTAPSILVTPSTGTAGSTVTVSGTGFSVSTPLASLVFDGVSITSCLSGSLTTGATGSFSCTFDVPSGTTGTTVTATDVGGANATGTPLFTVTTPTSSSGFSWWWIVLVIVLVAVILIVLIVTRRRRQPTPVVTPIPEWDEGDQPAAASPPPITPSTPPPRPLVVAVPTPNPAPTATPTSGVSRMAASVGPVSPAAAPLPATKARPAKLPGAQEPLPEIDELMAELERISDQIPKDTLKKRTGEKADEPKDESS